MHRTVCFQRCPKNKIRKLVFTCPNLSPQFGFSNFFSNTVLRHYWIQKFLSAYSHFFLLICRIQGKCLKVPKCEIFHLFDFNDFYGIKSLYIGGNLRAEIKNKFFLNVGQTRTILSLLAYVPSTLATIFDFELAQNKVVSDSPEVHWMCQNSFFEFSLFYWFKLDLVKMAKLACDQLC